MGDVTAVAPAEAPAARRAMRRSPGLPEDVLPVETVGVMISDGIGKGRRAGRGDQSIVDLVRHTAGETVRVDRIARSAVPPEGRGHGA